MPDLSGCSIRQVTRLAGCLRNGFDHKCTRLRAVRQPLSGFRTFPTSGQRSGSWRNAGRGLHAEPAARPFVVAAAQAAVEFAVDGRLRRLPRQGWRLLDAQRPDAARSKALFQSQPGLRGGRRALSAHAAATPSALAWRARAGDRHRRRAACGSMKRARARSARIRVSFAVRTRRALGTRLRTDRKITSPDDGVRNVSELPRPRRATPFPAAQAGIIGPARIIPGDRQTARNRAP